MSLCRARNVGSRRYTARQRAASGPTAGSTGPVGRLEYSQLVPRFPVLCCAVLHTTVRYAPRLGRAEPGKAVPSCTGQSCGGRRAISACGYRVALPMLYHGRAEQWRRQATQRPASTLPPPLAHQAAEQQQTSAKFTWPRLGVEIGASSSDGRRRLGGARQRRRHRMRRRRLPRRRSDAVPAPPLAAVRWERVNNNGASAAAISSGRLGRR